jgi:transcriptional regulator with XRE-family HTH domain
LGALSRNVAREVREGPDPRLDDLSWYRYKKIIMRVKEEEQSLRFGAVLRRHRQRAGLTVTEVARRIGRTQSYVSQLESGALHPPDDEVLSKIAAALNIDEDMLMVEAGRFPTALRKPLLEWARRDLTGFKQSVTASTAAIFEVSYDGSRPPVNGDVPHPHSDGTDPSEDDGGGQK